MRRQLLLIVGLALAVAAEAADAQNKTAKAGGVEAADSAKREAGADSKLVLFCNTTSECRPCGALRLNEHCRSSGGYALAACTVASEGSEAALLPFDFKRSLKDDRHLEEGSTVTKHHGCTPVSRLSVGRFLLCCAVGAAAALLVVRLRARQLSRRLGF